jgi:hypothetical protein
VEQGEPPVGVLRPSPPGGGNLLQFVLPDEFQLDGPDSEG